MKKFGFCMMVILGGLTAYAQSPVALVQSPAALAQSPVALVQSPAALAQSPVAPLPVMPQHLVVISHRGYHLHVPENSIASIEQAIKVGVDFVEIDLRTTKDGYLVLSHDASVNRMTSGNGNVRDLTLTQIQSLTLHSPDSTDKNIYTIPQFKEVLAVCKGKINIYLDFKEADVKETYRQIKEAGMEKQIVVYINKPEQYPQWRAIAPHMPLMASLPRNASTPAQFEAFMQATPVEVLDNVTDTALLAAVNQKGVAVWLDVEGPNESPVIWDAVIRKGVQGMQTDHPDALVKYLVAQGAR
jgi:glycerophosphoryl diester phosphodiesterase